MVDSNNNDTEISEDQLEEQALQMNVTDFAYRSEAKAKPQRREPANYSPSIIPMNARNWIDIEPGNRWKACLAAGGGAKRRYQYCTDVLGIIVYLRALEGHSGRNLIDPSLQDNVVIQSGFFHHIYHIACVFNLHSIINNGLILGGQNSSKRQTVFFLLVDLINKSHKDPEQIDFSVPRPAQYLHNAWKKHQDALFWVDIDLAIRKGLTFYQTRSNLSSFKEYFQLIVFHKLLD